MAAKGSVRSHEKAAEPESLQWRGQEDITELVGLSGLGERGERERSRRPCQGSEGESTADQASLPVRWRERLVRQSKVGRRELGGKGATGGGDRN